MVMVVMVVVLGLLHDPLSLVLLSLLSLLLLRRRLLLLFVQLLSLLLLHQLRLLPRHRLHLMQELMVGMVVRVAVADSFLRPLRLVRVLLVQLLSRLVVCLLLLLWMTSG